MQMLSLMSSSSMIERGVMVFDHQLWRLTGGRQWSIFHYNQVHLLLCPVEVAMVSCVSVLISFQNAVNHSVSQARGHSQSPARATKVATLSIERYRNSQLPFDEPKSPRTTNRRSADTVSRKRWWLPLARRVGEFRSQKER